ncbi:MAG: DUF4878 domain-containing protein [Fibromonadaceae bacterium]|jgi:ABC-type transporter MlaC component|nr:DUF4878 domain-containing protein [Fibromonadaceae bacterium]
MKKGTLLLAAFVTLFLVACGGGGAGTPEAVAEKYLKASLNSDYGTMKKLATEKQKAEIEKRENEEKGKSKDIPPEKKEMVAKMKAMTPKAEEAKISEDGNSANVRVPLFDKKGEPANMTFRYRVVKENGKWKVDGESK